MRIARSREEQEELLDDEEQADDDEEDSQPVMTQAFSYPAWDDEDEKARWRVAEWSDEGSGTGGSPRDGRPRRWLLSVAGPLRQIGATHRHESSVAAT